MGWFDQIQQQTADIEAKQRAVEFERNEPARQALMRATATLDDPDAVNNAINSILPQIQAYSNDPDAIEEYTANLLETAKRAGAESFQDWRKQAWQNVRQAKQKYDREQANKPAAFRDRVQKDIRDFIPPELLYADKYLADADYGTFSDLMNKARQGGQILADQGVNAFTEYNPDGSKVNHARQIIEQARQQAQAQAQPMAAPAQVTAPVTPQVQQPAPQTPQGAIQAAIDNNNPYREEKEQVQNMVQNQSYYTNQSGEPIARWSKTKDGKPTTDGSGMPVMPREQDFIDANKNIEAALRAQNPYLTSLGFGDGLEIVDTLFNDKTGNTKFLASSAFDALGLNLKDAKTQEQLATFIQNVKEAVKILNSETDENGNLKYGKDKVTPGEVIFAAMQNANSKNYGIQVAGDLNIPAKLIGNGLVDITRDIHQNRKKYTDQIDYFKNYMADYNNYIEIFKEIKNSAKYWDDLLAKHGDVFNSNDRRWNSVGMKKFLQKELDNSIALQKKYQTAAEKVLHNIANAYDLN